MHQLIRHFGRSYAAEVFASTPHLRRTFLVLADCAYYLIFAAYVLVNVHFERPPRFDAAGNPVGFRWGETVSAAQLQESVFSIAGICLLIGILHGFNVFVLPFVGSGLALWARLVQGRSRWRKEFPTARKPPPREVRHAHGSGFRLRLVGRPAP